LQRIGNHGGVAIEYFYHLFHSDYACIVLSGFRARGMPQKEAGIYGKTVDKRVLALRTVSRRRVRVDAGAVSDTAGTEPVCEL
jgi:hypothetical protein